MRTRIACVSVALSLVVACTRAEEASPPAATRRPVAARPAPAAPGRAPAQAAPPRVAAAGAPTAATPTKAPAAEDLAAFAAGSLVVAEPGPDTTHNASWLLRGPFETEGFWAVDKPGPQTVVIQLPGRSRITRVELDTAMVGNAAKDVTVEISDTGPKSGFTTLVAAALQNRVDNQAFPVSTPTPGRWLRLTAKTSFSPTATGIGRFRAFGTRLDTAPLANASGTYATRNGDMHIRQEGTSVVGCYAEHGGTFEGGLEGRVVKLTWHEKVTEHPAGAAFLVFSDDAQRFAGLFSYAGEDPNTGRFWTGTRRTSAVGTCPDWVGDAEKQLAKTLEEKGRARLYGINFDVDSDRLRDESKPTLGHVAAVLKAHPQWRLTLEGHTDSTATAQHNQDLSERRARSVGRYLEQAGIAAARVKTVGFGATRPVARNDTALGRAQNRRVELVRQ